MLRFYLKRGMALFYDLLVLLSILLIGTLLSLPFSKGAAFPPHHRPYQLFLLSLIVLFFVGFWIKGGQTLGLRAWKLRVVSNTDSALTLKQACIRLLTGLILGLTGITWIWACFDTDKRTLHDRLSQTKIRDEKGE